MLERVALANGVVFYRSPLLHAAGVPHTFSTRCGGVSAGPFDSLNLGNPNGHALQDDLQNVAQNYRRLLEAIGRGGHELCRVHQVHGRVVVDVNPGAAFDNSAQADALVGDDPQRLLSVRTADCVPILLATADGRGVAAVHAGWRGVVGGVVPAAIQRMHQRFDRTPILAAIGPCIGAEAFEVGPEVVHEFRRTFGPRAPLHSGRGDRGHIDLRRAVQLQLIDAGLGDSAIDLTDRCTARDRDEFFSHRRDDGCTGRMAAVIGPASRS